MNCSVITDLMPLCIDGCASEESVRLVNEHVCTCEHCKKAYNEMIGPIRVQSVSERMPTLSRVKEWQAQILQSVLLFASFALIVIGVTLEAGVSSFDNGFFASCIIIPSTALMLSLPNWYFVRQYKSRILFSLCTPLIILTIAMLGYLWAAIHYDDIPSLALALGAAMVLIFCVLSFLLSNKYARVLGKE